MTIDDDAPVEVYGLTKIQLAEGRHRVRVGEPVNDEFEFEMGSGYFGCWTKTPGCPINVDGGAVPVAETLRYAARPRPSEIRLVVGERFFYMPHVDYLLVDVPKLLKTDKKDGQVVKTRLDRTGEPAQYLVPARHARGRFGQRLPLRRGPPAAQPRRSVPVGHVTFQEAQHSGDVERARQFFRRPDAAAGGRGVASRVPATGHRGGQGSRTGRRIRRTATEGAE